MSTVEDDPAREVAKPGPLPAPVPPIPTDITEVTESPRTDHSIRAPEGLEGAPGSAALAAFLRFHPFMGFFIWLADMQYPATHTGDIRVAKHKEICPRLYWTCVAFDFVVTLLAVIGILVLAGAVAYKAVWL